MPGRVVYLRAGYMPNTGRTVVPPAFIDAGSRVAYLRIEYVPNAG